MTTTSPFTREEAERGLTRTMEETAARIAEALTAAEALTIAIDGYTHRQVELESDELSRKLRLVATVLTNLQAASNLEAQHAIARHVLATTTEAAAHPRTPPRRQHRKAPLT